MNNCWQGISTVSTNDYIFFTHDYIVNSNLMPQSNGGKRHQCYEAAHEVVLLQTEEISQSGLAAMTIVKAFCSYKSLGTVTIIILALGTFSI